MRVRPAVGLNITRLVPPEGAEIGGKKFPGGTRVAVNGWVLHRSKEIFGADPKVFRPERWLEGDAKNMERYMFQFGGGSHVCKSSQRILYQLLVRSLLMRLIPRHREKPGFARDEQDIAAPVP
jgi:cytochrome P450